ncbi:MAG: flagellar hook-basal body complex protein [Syntrophales bacterium]|jgi:flagellar hook protein FlgE|nr:flagellar hook-basal body complex protein [Syntrophales bacterium]
MATSLWIGTTGLSGSEKQLDVIANNLANANTPGFKASDTFFNSMLSQNLAGGSQQRVGQGVGVSAITKIFDQGSFESSGNATDVAIDGNGFFIVKDSDNRTLYTRAGGFEVNKTGFLADKNDYTVQGHMFDETGLIEDTSLTDMDLRNIQSVPKSSTTFSLGLTLDSQTKTGETFDVSQVLYDSRGAEHSLSTTFMKTENASYWGVKTTMDGAEAEAQQYSGIKFDSQGLVEMVYTADVTPAPAVTTAGDGDAVLKVNNSGQLYKDTTAPIVLTRGADTNTWTFTNGGYENMSLNYGISGADDLIGIDMDGIGGDDITFTLTGAWALDDAISFNIVQNEEAAVDKTVRFYAAGGALADGATIGLEGDLTWNLVGEGAENIRSFAATSKVASLTIDGYAPGTVTSLDVKPNGLVEGMFSNGQRQNVARLMLADFANLQGLNMTGSYFVETNESGPVVINKPATGGLGQIQSHSIEMSNTDTGREFIKMIMAQRAYQSSAKVITTADQMTQVLMNVKQ